MLIVDAGPLVAYLNRNDRDHDRCAAYPGTRHCADAAALTVRPEHLAWRLP
jgi:hypothetical protein